MARKCCPPTTKNVIITFPARELWTVLLSSESSRPFLRLLSKFYKRAYVPTYVRNIYVYKTLKYVLFFCNPFDKNYILSLVKRRLRTRVSSERYLRNCKYAFKSCYLLHEFHFLRCIYVTTNNNNNTTSAHSRDNFSNETSSPGIGDRNPFFFCFISQRFVRIRRKLVISVLKAIFSW